MKASSKEENSDEGGMSNARRSTPYEENDSRTSGGTGSESSKTPARELAHVATLSNALESPANEIASLEAPMETPETGPACAVTPGAPEPKYKGKVRNNSLVEKLEDKDGSPTPKSGMYSQFCCVLWEW